MKLLAHSLLVLAGAAGGIAMVLSCGGASATMADAADAPRSDPPIVVMGPMKTADTDLSRLVRGAVPFSAGTANGAVKVTDGPVVITDLSGDAGSGYQFVTFFVAKSSDGCGQAKDVVNGMTGSILRTTGSDMDIHGARMIVNAGETLCAYQGAATMTIAWSGFRPYD
jgi:hypothetical protein